ncbi:hypothetical protein ACH35V_40605 [Actinomadura sp. 1N219]|uniref:hypothetical protein n=1 Tax=Actinomadura sp. 1N219 TaxID=3375152 RepID=UPI0037A42245
MSTKPQFFPPSGDRDEALNPDLDGKLTAEQGASLAVGLTEMQPVPTPSELKIIAGEASAHSSVTLDSEMITALISGVTHPHEVTDQLVHPNAIAEQLQNRRTGNRRKLPPPAVSTVGRLQRLATDTCYATAALSPLHLLPGLKVLVVNPRFLARLQHTFTSGKVTDPTLEGSAPGLLKIRLPSPVDLRRMITGMVKYHLLDYDWSGSIARTGVQEPLVAMLMRVYYDDGRSEMIIVVIDGQSRLVSAWRNMLGHDPGKNLARADTDEVAHQIVGQMFAHDAVAQSRKTVNSTLETIKTRGTTSREIRVLHSQLAPVNLVLGTFTRSGEPCDTTLWFTEFLTQIHLRTRPWTGGSDREKAVADALSAAARQGRLTEEQAAALSGHLYGADFTRATGLPFHPAYARAALIEAVLSAESGPVIRTAIAEYLSLDPHDPDKFMRELRAVVATFATRFLRSDTNQAFPQVVHAWTDGGAITKQMMDRVAADQNAVSLTRLSPDRLGLPPQEAAAAAIADLRKRAEEDEDARAELALLGGDALIVAEALTRDRGSKEDLQSDKPRELRTPYRAKPPTIIAGLSATAAGRLMLGDALANWAERVPGDPEDFSRGFTVPKVATDGDSVPHVVTSYGLPERAIEWDVFDVAFDGLPSSRRSQINKRRVAARHNEDSSDARPVTLEQFQTKIHSASQALSRILDGEVLPHFGAERDRESLQQYVWKMAIDIGKIPFDPPPPAPDVYRAPDEEDDP